MDGASRRLRGEARYLDIQPVLVKYEGIVTSTSLDISLVEKQFDRVSPVTIELGFPPVHSVLKYARKPPSTLR